MEKFLPKNQWMPAGIETIKEKITED